MNPTALGACILLLAVVVTAAASLVIRRRPTRPRAGRASPSRYYDHDGYLSELYDIDEEA